LNEKGKNMVSDVRHQESNFKLNEEMATFAGFRP